MAGKNFSGNTGRVEKKRKKSDFYETPYSITKHLLAVENFDSNATICEPARGNGAITKVLKTYFNLEQITEYDIEKDFLNETKLYDYIITNPPFSIANEFIIKAKAVAKLKFAFLLPLSYLHGKARYDSIFTDKTYGLKTVYVFTRYPMLGELLREDGKYNTGMMVYAWYVFENNYSGKPFIDWIDNNKDVLSKKDLVKGDC
jgi:hypothetical protein